MGWTDAALVSGALAIALAALKLLEKGFERVRRNGSGQHPYEESRANAKLSRLIEVSQESLGVLKRIEGAEQETHRKLDKLCVLREVDEERHHSLKEQLDRIERGT